MRPVTDALGTRQLFQKFARRSEKPLKRLTVRSARCHRAKATVLMIDPSVLRGVFSLKATRRRLRRSSCAVGGMKLGLGSGPLPQGVEVSHGGHIHDSVGGDGS